MIDFINRCSNLFLKGLILAISLLILVLEFVKITALSPLEVRESSFILQTLALFDTSFYTSDMFRIANYSAYGPLSNLPFFPILFVKNKILVARLITFLINLFSLYLLFSFLKQKNNTLTAISICLMVYFPIAFLSGGMPRGDNFGQLLAIISTLYLLKNIPNKKTNPWILSLLFTSLLYTKIYYLIVPVFHLVLEKQWKLLVKSALATWIFIVPMEFFYYWAYGNFSLFTLFEFALNLNQNQSRSINWDWSKIQLIIFIKAFAPFIVPIILTIKQQRTYSYFVIVLLSASVFYLGTHTGNIHVYYLQTIPVFFVFLLHKPITIPIGLKPIFFSLYFALFFYCYFNPIRFIKQQLTQNKEIIVPTAETTMLQSANQLTLSLRTNHIPRVFDSYNTQYILSKPNTQAQNFTTDFHGKIHTSDTLYISSVGLLTENTNPFLGKFNEENWKTINQNFICSDTLQDLAPFASETFPVYVYTRKNLSHNH